MAPLRQVEMTTHGLEGAAPSAPCSRDGPLDVLAANPEGGLIAVVLGDQSGGLCEIAPIVIAGAPERLLVATPAADAVQVDAGEGAGAFTPFTPFSLPGASTLAVRRLHRVFPDLLRHRIGSRARP